MLLKLLMFLVRISRFLLLVLSHCMLFSFYFLLIFIILLFFFFFLSFSLFFLFVFSFVFSFFFFFFFSFYILFYSPSVFKFFLYRFGKRSSILVFLARKFIVYLVVLDTLQYLETCHHLWHCATQQSK